MTAPAIIPRTKQPCVVVMVKEPRAGNVKTRLGRDIGMIDAAQWYRRHSARMLYDIIDPRWTNVAAFTPTNARVKPSNAEFYIDQGHGHLGRRMMGALRKTPPRSVLIGSDILGVGPKQIWRAISLLATHDTVLGPSPDGGFWLIGFRNAARLSPFLLDGVRWSTSHAFEDTAKRLPGRLALADTLNDVDTVDDLP